MLRIFSIVLASAILFESPVMGQERNRFSLSPFQAAWTKVCGIDRGIGKQVCYTVRDFGLKPRKPPIVAIAVYDIIGRSSYVMRLMLPIGLRSDLGVAFSVDGGPVQKADIKVCLPKGCLAQAKFGDYIATLRHGHLIQIVALNSLNKKVTFYVLLNGFGNAFDGPGVTRDELQRRQKSLPHRRSIPPAGGIDL
jgi:invasion protein IalB